MQFAESLLQPTRYLLLAGFVGLLAACGGSSTTTSTTICKDPSICATPLAEQLTPTGPNTTEIVVDSGPLGAFVLGVTNVPYVTVTVCSPNMTTNDGCVTIDHVLLDTGSYGLRLLRSKLGAVAPLLPTVPIAANASNNTPAGDAAECYPFVIGTIWGPLAKADVHIGGELAYAQTIQVIDDGQAQNPPVPANPPVPKNCSDAAHGSLLTSVSMLQANGILGVGMIAVDCGVACLDNAYPGMSYVYYSCPTGATTCMPAAMPIASQVQNPVVGFAVNNNGTMITMPALPKLGANVAKGRLVFGIGTQSNNTPAALGQYPVETDPTSANYLYVSMQVGAHTYPQSYIDSGSNAMFFDSTDPALAGTCNVSTGQQGGWYCPTATWSQSAKLIAANAAQGTFTLNIDSADTLFSINGATAFANLAGTAGQGASTFALGMPFLYGKKVFTSIWHQQYSTLNGPWYAIE